MISDQGTLINVFLLFMLIIINKTILLCIFHCYFANVRKGIYACFILFKIFNVLARLK